jgi:hypothetical protein
LPVSSGMRRFVSVALVRLPPHARSSGRCAPSARLSAQIAPPRLSPGTPLCAARTFLWGEPQRPSRPDTPMDLVKGPHAACACGVLPDQMMVPKEGFEPSRPNGHYALNVARLPIPPLRHEVEPTIGFEPMTCCLRNSCSAAELRRPYDRRDSTMAFRTLQHVHLPPPSTAACTRRRRPERDRITRRHVPHAAITALLPAVRGYDRRPQLCQKCTSSAFLATVRELLCANPSTHCLTGTGVR